MSNAIFPTLPGLDIEITKDIEFSTLVHSSRTGAELRIAQRAYPMYRLGLKFNFLRDTTAFPELKSLCGFYMLRQGPADSFLIQDPDDYLIPSTAQQQIGVGNGAITAFQATRAFGSFAEPVFNLVSGTYGVYLNGVLQSSGVSVNGTGMFTFSTPPGAGVVVTWSGQYYFRARFLEDRLNVKRFLNQVWSGQSVPMLATLQDKIK